MPCRWTGLIYKALFLRWKCALPPHPFPAFHWIYWDQSTGSSLLRWWGSLRWRARSLRIWLWRSIIPSSTAHRLCTPRLTTQRMLWLSIIPSSTAHRLYTPRLTAQRILCTSIIPPSTAHRLCTPIYPREYYPAFQRGYEVKHLLDYYREIASWRAFAVFLQYFPERKNSPEYHIVTGDRELSMFLPGDSECLWGTHEYRFTLHFIPTADLHLTGEIAGGKAQILADGRRNNTLSLSYSYLWSYNISNPFWNAQ